MVSQTSTVGLPSSCRILYAKKLTHIERSCTIFSIEDCRWHAMHFSGYNLGETNLKAFRISYRGRLSTHPFCDAREVFARWLGHDHIGCVFFPLVSFHSEKKKILMNEQQWKRLKQYEKKLEIEKCKQENDEVLSLTVVRPEYFEGIPSPGKTCYLRLNECFVVDDNQNCWMNWQIFYGYHSTSTILTDQYCIPFMLQKDGWHVWLSRDTDISFRWQYELKFATRSSKLLRWVPFVSTKHLLDPRPVRIHIKDTTYLQFPEHLLSDKRKILHFLWEEYQWLFRKLESHLSGSLVNTVVEYIGFKSTFRIADFDFSRHGRKWFISRFAQTRSFHGFHVEFRDGHLVWRCTLDQLAVTRHREGYDFDEYLEIDLLLIA